jgi:hypothetical protein
MLCQILREASSHRGRVADVHAAMLLNPLAILEYSMLSSIFVMTSSLGLSVCGPRYPKRQSARILPVLYVWRSVI